MRWMKSHGDSIYLNKPHNLIVLVINEVSMNNEKHMQRQQAFYVQQIIEFSQYNS